jgi:hypothetical protein
MRRAHAVQEENGSDRSVAIGAPIMAIPPDSNY